MDPAPTTSPTTPGPASPSPVGRAFTVGPPPPFDTELIPVLAAINQAVPSALTVDMLLALRQAAAPPRRARRICTAAARTP